jgi:DNA-binding CsgD family transcriptional regulator
MFLISKPDKDSLASTRRIVYLYSGGYRTCRAQRTETTKPRSQPRFSVKELAIITSVMQGNRNKKIARQLGRTEQVIKNYLHNVYHKLGISDRLELANYVLHHQLHRETSKAGLLAAAAVPSRFSSGGINGNGLPGQGSAGLGR